MRHFLDLSNCEPVNDPSSLSVYVAFAEPPTAISPAYAEVATREPAKLKELRRELNEWRKKVGAERMEPNPDYQK